MEELFELYKGLRIRSIANDYHCLCLDLGDFYTFKEFLELRIPGKKGCYGESFSVIHSESLEKRLPGEVRAIGTLYWIALDIKPITICSPEDLKFYLAYRASEMALSSSPIVRNLGKIFLKNG